MKKFHVVVMIGSTYISDDFESNDECIAMNMAVSHFSKTCNVQCDDILIIDCEEVNQ